MMFTKQFFKTMVSDLGGGAVYMVGFVAWIVVLLMGPAVIALRSTFEIADGEITVWTISGAFLVPLLAIIGNYIVVKALSYDRSK